MQKRRTSTIIIIAAILSIGILSQSLNLQSLAQTRVIKIADMKTGSNFITLGSQSNPIPLGGYQFTVNVTLEGLTNNLYVYQIAVKFDKDKIRCTSAWINRNDPNFVFYSHKSLTYIPPAAIDNTEGYVVLGASLIGDRQVDVSKGLLCQINFTAIKKGETQIELIPTGYEPYDTFLGYFEDDNLRYISFTTENFNCIVQASQTPPLASFTFNPKNPEANQPVTFDASGSYDPDGYIANYTWDFGDGTNTTTNQQSVNHTFTSNGAYNVTLTVYDNSTRSSSTREEVQVGRLPIVKFTYQPAQIQPFQPVTFNAAESQDPDGTIARYVWNFGDGNTTTTYTHQITHIFNSRGAFRVNLTVYDNEGLHNSTAKEIFVGKPPSPNFTYTTPRAVEDYFIVTFNASQSQAGEEDGYIVSYVWDFDDHIGIVETQSPIIEHIYMEGDYEVKLTVYDNNGLHNSITKTIKVKVEKTKETNGTDITIYLVAAAAAILVIIVVLKLVRKKSTSIKQKKKKRK
ncbi:MAG: PKD domain-containing protein [Candidatus Bathyarchaeia archaeon]